MKYIFLTLFLVHAALAAPHHIEEEIIDEDAMPMALPQIEEGVVEDIEVKIDDEEKEIEEGDAEAAFMRMINLGRSYGGMPSFGYGMNRGMRSMMPQNKGAQGYSGNSQGYSGNSQGYGAQGYGAQSYGMYNPMMGGMGGMGGMYNPMMDPMSQMMGGMGGGMYPMDPMSQMMDQMMGGMGGMGGYNPMMGGMGGMGGYNPMMDPMSQMMGGMGGMGGYNPMMGGMGGMGGYNPMMDMMGGMGGYNPMMDGMGGYNPMMDGMGGYNPMMDGMGGYDQMMGGMEYTQNEPQKDQYVEFYEYQNEDFPTDYTLPCSDHCACDQVCKSTRGRSCTCRCPPKCSAPGIFV